MMRLAGPAARAVQIAIGVWLIAAPAVLDYGDPAAGNDRIFGPVAASFAFVALWDVVAPLRWAVAPVALWLVVAPLALTYDDWTPVVNSVAAGSVLLATSPIGNSDRSRFWGGWRSVIRPPADAVAGGPQRGTPSRP